MKISIAITSFAALVSLSLSANGAAVIYEPFAQTPGTLDGQAASSTGLTGNWSDDQTVNVVAQDLSYGSLENSGNQADLTSGNSTDAWVSTSSALSDAGLLDDGATMWFSFMYSKTATGGSTNEKGGFSLGTDRLDSGPSGANMINSGSGIGARVFATNAAAASWTGGAQQIGTGSSAISLNTSYLVVGQVVWGATSTDDDIISLYLVDQNTLTLGAAISTENAGALNQTAFDTISMTQRNSGGTVTYDEIRFGATFADVTPVPEPSIALLGGLGLLGLFRRRRS